MNTAVPMINNKVSGHFTKAETFLLLDASGNVTSQLDNPALSGGCAGKTALCDLFSQRNISRVIVRNIGEQMLSKLLALDIAVYKINKAQPELSAFHQDNPDLEALTQASQGRPSTNHQAKQASGGCGCGSSGHSAESSSEQQTASSHSSSSSHSHGGCCGKKCSGLG